MSPSGRIRATWDAKAGTRVEDVKRHKVLWSILDSHRSLLVADDGKHLVERYDGLNLLPTDFSDDPVLLTFCARKKASRCQSQRFRAGPPHSGADCFVL
ncbi:MAG: hypothetical protein DMF48_05170 [Verrucomicrobia bacterium]|jgi:hypothetical protein|nr:MAG: hypothetical protein DMF48_05170 [Verrucomicrobiota bacterium]